MKIHISSFIIVLLLLIPFGSQAQLLEIKQTVYGMDCAPCAYGLENRIQKMEGIEAVSVSLNEGLLMANLQKSNQLSLADIRKAVEESGFKAREANITVEGTLTKNDSGNYFLETGTGERFMLAAKDQSIFNDFPQTETDFVIIGKVEASDETGNKLWIKTINKSKS